MFLYVKVKNGDAHLPRGLFNAYIADFAECLKGRVMGEFGADSAIVESVRGTVSFMNKQGELVRGELVKIPRPKNLEDVDRLQHMPVYTLADLRKVVYDYRCKDENEYWEKFFRGEATVLAILRPPEEKKPKKKKRPEPKDDQTLANALYDDNPNIRVFRATC
jgi:hypothetical protein